MADSDSDPNSVHNRSEELRKALHLDESYLDVDLIEVDDLLNSASRLLEEVYNNRGSAPPSSLSPRENAMQQVQRFIDSLRPPEEEEDVVFVEARPGNAPPASARTTAVVDLCTPTNTDEGIPPTRTSRRRRRADDIVPIEFPSLDSVADSSKNSTRTRRIKPKPEPVDADESVVNLDTPDTHGKKARTPPGPSGNTPSLICSVCMDSVVSRQPTSTSCGHIFCKSCIMQAIRLTKKCPLCNCKLKPNQVHRVYF